MRILILIGITVLVSACTVAKPLELSQAHETDNKVFVAIADAYYQRDLGSQIRFWKQTFSVIDTLDDQPGFLGFSARIELLDNRATTMTAWKDKASMREFAYGDSLHKEIVKRDTTLIDSVFYGAEFNAEALPTWDQALELLSDKGRHYYE